MNPIIKFILFFVIPIGIFILWIGGFFSERIPPGYKQVQPRIVKGVKVGKVKAYPVEERYKAEGYTTSKETAKVATKIMGKVLDIKVKEGDKIQKGQVLALIDTSDIKAQEREVLAGFDELKSAKKEALAGKKAVEAQLEFLQTTYKRLKNLYEANAVPKQKVDEIEAKLNGTKAQLEQIEAKLKQINAKEKQLKAKLSQVKIMEGYGVIKAPFSGYVVKKIANVGDMAAPGMPLFVIGNKDIQFQALIDAKYVDRVKVGDKLKVHIDPLNKDFVAPVVEKNSNADPANNSFSIKVDLPEEKNLGVGFYGRTWVPVKTTKKILIPPTAIKRWYEVAGVFIVRNDGLLKFTPVKLGEVYNGMYEVKSGLKEGQMIVIEGVERACDGCKVRL